MGRGRCGRGSRRTMPAGVWVGVAACRGDLLGGRFVIGRSAFKTVQEPARASLSATNRFGAGKDASQHFEALLRLPAGSGRIAPFGEASSILSRSAAAGANGSGRCGLMIPAKSCRRIRTPWRASGRGGRERWNSPTARIVVDTAGPAIAAGMERRERVGPIRAGSLCTGRGGCVLARRRCGVEIGGHGGSRSSTACPPEPFRRGWIGAARIPRPS